MIHFTKESIIAITFDLYILVIVLLKELNTKWSLERKVRNQSSQICQSLAFDNEPLYV